MPTWSGDAYQDLRAVTRGESPWNGHIRVGRYEPKGTWVASRINRKRLEHMVHSGAMGWDSTGTSMIGIQTRCGTFLMDPWIGMEPATEDYCETCLLTNEPGTFIVYRFFGIDDVLLYVGYTARLGSRLRNHRLSTPWWPEVRRMITEPYRDEFTARRTESVAIKSERPKYNSIGSSKPTAVAPRQKPRLASLSAPGPPSNCVEVLRVLSA